jgi:YD repeat-containing protein
MKTPGTILSIGLILLIHSGFANAQHQNSLNLDKDFRNSQYKANHIERVKKIFSSPAAQWTAVYQYDADGYLVSFEHDSALAAYLSITNPDSRKIDIRYSPGRDKAFILSNSDTIDRLSFNEKKNLVFRSFTRPAGYVTELKYYYEDNGDLKFITMRSTPLMDESEPGKWMNMHSFSYYYREGKLRSRRSDNANTKFLYDTAGRLSEEYDSASRKGWIKYEYNNADKLIAAYEMRPGNKDFTFCPYFTQYTYDKKGRLSRKIYAVSAKNDKMGNCGYTQAWSVDYKYLRSGLLKQETKKAKDGSGYIIRYKYR